MELPPLQPCSRLVGDCLAVSDGGGCSTFQTFDRLVCEAVKGEFMSEEAAHRVEAVNTIRCMRDVYCSRLGVVASVLGGVGYFPPDKRGGRRKKGGAAKDEADSALDLDEDQDGGDWPISLLSDRLMANE